MKTQIVKKNDFTSVLLSLIIIFGGITITFINFDYSKGIGSILIIMGIIALSLCRKTTVHNTTGYKIESHTLFFSTHDKEKLIKICQKKEFYKLKDLTPDGQGLQMDIYLAKNGEYGAVQLYEYVPFKYEICSPLFEFEGEASMSLSNYIKTLYA